MTSMRLSEPQRSAVKMLPKVELHLHYEGCIQLESIETLARSGDQPMIRRTKDLYSFNDLEEFLSTLDWICNLVDSEHQIKTLSQSLVNYLRGQNIVCAEIIINPSHWRLSLDSLLLPILAEFARAESQFGITLGLLPSIGRHQKNADAMQLVDWCVSNSHPNLRGFSIDGSERGGSRTDQFISAFKKAKESGLGITAHAGESSGPQGVVAALDQLGVDRLDHGVRAVEDPALMSRLAAEGIPLNVCVSSNCHNLYSSYDQHPLPQLLAKGLICTINTDDPAMLDIDLSSELVAVADAYDLSLGDLKQLQLNATRAAFCPLEVKAQLAEQIENEWSAIT